LVRNLPRRNRANITEEEGKRLISITRRKYIVVEEADKEGAVVVMDKQWY